MKKCLGVLVVWIGLLTWYMLTYHWTLSVDTIQFFTRKKYATNNPSVITTTPFFAWAEKQGTQEIENYPKKGNAEYDAFTSREFNYNDTEVLFPLGNYELECLPKIFGYNLDKGNAIFPYTKYPKCSEITTSPDAQPSLDFEKNEFTMNCTGKYVLGPPDSRKLVLRHEVEDL